jgi:Glycosyl transferase family 2
MTIRLIQGTRVTLDASGAPIPLHGCYDADIVILSLERVVETIAAIRSACEQTEVSVQVFVLDQGSRPETLQHLAEACGERANVTLLAVDENLGVAGGRNLISGLGCGRVIVALDNDAEFATEDTVARMVAALDAEPQLGAIGCRIVTYADGADDLSSWGYPADLLACAGENFDSVTYVGAGQRSGGRHGNRPAAMMRNCSSAGKNSTSACVRSRWAGASATAATLSSATRSVRNSASAGPALGGSISYETGCTSTASWAAPGLRWRPAPHSTC